MKPDQEKMETCLNGKKACLEKRGASQEKSEAKEEEHPEGIEGNQEKIEATADHSKWVPYVQATHHPADPGFRCSTWR
jgi:hypothetical protein